MNKVTRIILAIGLILAVATPVLAEVKITGNYRLMAYNNQLKDTDYKDGDSQQWIDQRMRIGVVNTLNDNVSITYLAEIDTVWGTDNSSTAGNDGAFDGDGVNVESKLVFLDLKTGGTSARLGLQTYGDDFQGMVVFADMTGAAVTHKINNTTLGLLYAKWDENDGDRNSGATPGRSTWDDTDFYGVTVKQKFTDNFSAGAAVYFLDINDISDPRSNVDDGLPGWDTYGSADAADAELFYYGLTADATFGDFGINGFVLYQDGEIAYADSTEDQDSEALAASVKGTFKLPNGNIGLRGIYISEDDDDEDNGYWQGDFGEYEFVNENQMIFLIDKFTQNATKEHYAIQDSAREGYGLMAFILSGNHTLPENMYVNWGLGYYAALEDERNDESSASREGDTLGYEACVRVGKKVFEKVDISLNVAYAEFGDFYDETFQDSDEGRFDEDPDGIYKAYLMVNVPF